MSKVKDFQKVYKNAYVNFVNNYDPANVSSFLYGVGCSMNDLPFFGYALEDIKHENELFSDVIYAYNLFRESLEKAIEG